jgi:hypothetical protein
MSWRARDVVATRRFAQPEFPLANRLQKGSAMSRSLPSLFLLAVALCGAAATTACSAITSGEACDHAASEVVTVPLSRAETTPDAGRSASPYPRAVGDDLDVEVCMTLCPGHLPICILQSVEGDQATLSCHADCS